MKIVTSLLETIGYFCKMTAIYTALMFLKYGDFLNMLIGFAIYYLVGALLIGAEKKLEIKKNLIDGKHYDSSVLRIFGWILLIGSLFSILTAISKAKGSIDVGMIFASIYMIFQASSRKNYYEKLNRQQKEQKSDNNE